MVKIPTYESQANLSPTPMDPQVASNQGREIVDIGKGMEGLGESLQKLQNKRDTLKAELYLAKAHDVNRKMAYTDTDLNTLEDRLAENSEKHVSEAANLISDPASRDTFVAKASLETERRNVPLYNTVFRRQSQDVKALITANNDEDIKEYQSLANPQEREMVRNKIIDRTKTAMSDGHINPEIGQKHLDTMLKQMDIDQIKNDISVDPQLTYENLQKGDEGIYPHVSPAIRKQYADRAMKQITKDGEEDKFVHGIAQNHADNVLIDMFGKNQLTQESINNAQLMGIRGIKPSPQIIKAATEALQSSFPQKDDPKKYNDIFDKTMSSYGDDIESKADILKSKELTPNQKAFLINGVFGDRPQEGQKSMDQMISSGIKQNKQEIMEAHNKLSKEISDRKDTFLGINNWFRDHAKDSSHLAELKQDFMAKIQKSNDIKDTLDIARGILKNDTLKRNPKISNADPKHGTVFQNNVTGEKLRYFPDGSSEQVKNAY